MSIDQNFHIQHAIDFCLNCTAAFHLVPYLLGSIYRTRQSFTRFLSVLWKDKTACSLLIHHMSQTALNIQKFKAIVKKKKRKTAIYDTKNDRMSQSIFPLIYFTYVMLWWFRLIDHRQLDRHNLSLCDNKPMWAIIAVLAFISCLPAGHERKMVHLIFSKK